MRLPDADRLRMALRAAALFPILLPVLPAGPVAAQRVIVDPVRPPVVVTPPVALPPSVTAPRVGGGVLQSLPQAPVITPQVSPPVAVPAARARVVRFRCEVAPHDQSCREAGAPDGGGDDSECNCARDACYDRYDAAGGYTTRTCEKLQ